MRNDCCIISCKTSKIAASIFFFTWVIIATLLHFSNSHVLIKLILQALTSLYIIYIFSQHHNHKSKYEILFKSQNLIIWKIHTSQLTTITKWYAVGSICIVIKVKDLKNINKTLIFFKDNCDNTEFKQIMKQIKWYPIKTH